MYRPKKKERATRKKNTARTSETRVYFGASETHTASPRWLS